MLWRRFINTEDTILAFVLRLSLGIVMFPHGAQKLLDWFGGASLAGYVELFHRFGFSTTVAVLVTIGEFFGGLGLIIGLLSRVAAGGLALIMAGAVLTVNGKYGFFINWAGDKARKSYEFHILVIGLAIGIIIVGGGKWPIDSALTRTWKERIKTV